MTKRLQFDSLGIAAFTVVVAAVVAIGRQFFDAGAMLASVLFPACLLFAVGSLRVKRRALLGAVSIIAPLIGVFAGSATQILLWGAVWGISWVVSVSIALTTLLALLLLWGPTSRKLVIAPTILVAFCTAGWLIYQFQATTGERWVAASFPATAFGNSSGGKYSGRVWIAPTFKTPAAFGSDLRRVEGPGWRIVHQARQLLGVSAASSLQVEQPLRPEEWELISKLKQLKRLDLANIVVDENVICQLAEISTLKNISLRDCEITASLAALSKLKSLTALSLVRVKTNPFQGLERLQDLEGLFVSYTPIDLSLVRALVKLPNLIGLHVIGDSIVEQQFDDAMLRILIDKKKEQRRAGNMRWLHRCSIPISHADVSTLVDYCREFATPGVPLLSGMSPEKVQAVRSELEKTGDFVQVESAYGAEGD